jgi:hypothetical protein
MEDAYGEEIQETDETRLLFQTIVYNQPNKDEIIISVIKRLFDEHVTSSRF